MVQQSWCTGVAAVASFAAVAGLVAVMVSGPSVAQTVQPIDADDQRIESAPSNPPPDRAGLDEVLVTAQRRAASLQDVPISITAVSQEMIDDREVDQVSDLQHMVPGLTFAQVVGTAQPTMRGVGSDLYTLSGEPGVALYVDDVYMGRSFLPSAALVQIERIEVLRGPQGTLYGRNTSGGALKFITKRPSREWTGSAAVQGGSYDQINYRANLSGPLWDDKLFGGITYFSDDHDGWTTNLVNGEKYSGHEVQSVRVALDAEPASWLSLSLVGDYQDQYDTGPVLFALTPLPLSGVSDSLAAPVLQPFDEYLALAEDALGFALDPIRESFIADNVGGHQSDDPRETYTDLKPTHVIDTKGVTGKAIADLGFADATVIAAWRDNARKFNYDADGTEVQFITFEPHITKGKQLSIEANLASTGEGWLNWLAGLYFYEENAYELIVVELFPLDGAVVDPLRGVLPETTALLQGRGLAYLYFETYQDTLSYAGFGEADATFWEWVTVRAGLRYTHDEKDANITYRIPDPTASCERKPVSEDWQSVTGRVGVDVRPWDDVMIFGSFSQGFKSGGFNSTGCDGIPYRPEKVDAIEVGFKLDLFDKRLRLNGAAFMYDFTDIQTQQIDLVTTIIVNAAEAEINGAELEFTALPFERLMIDGSVSWLDATYTDYTDDEALSLLEGPIDLSGNYLPKSPEWSANVGLQFNQPIGQSLQAMVRAEWVFKSRQYFSQFNREPNSQASYHLWNAYATLLVDEGRFGVQAFVKNITDKAYQEGGVIASALIGGPIGFYGPPRLWGIELNASF